MKKDKDGAILFSPSDLIVFMESKFASWMDRYHLEFPSEHDPAADDPSMKLLQEKGIEHERRYLERLKASGTDVCEVMRAGALRNTEQAIRDGRDVIYQGLLQLDNFAGWSDFLKKVPGESKLGEFCYEVWDTKLSRQPKPYFLVQLCCYAEMLESIQGVLPEHVGVVLGDLTERKFRTLDYYYFYLALKKDFLQAQKAFDPLKRPDLTANQDFRRWADLAEQILKDGDHLSQVANIRCTQIKKLEEADVTTMRGLVANTKRIPNMEVSTSEILTHQARLQIESAGLAVPKFDVLEQAPGERRGLALLAPASSLDVFFDMEGYPYAEGGLEYLFGASFYENGELIFKDWWAHDADQEKQAFEDFIDWTYARWQQDPTMHIYHYAEYEIIALRRLMSRYGTREAEFDNLLRNEAFINLYTVVRQGLRVGVPSYSIKKIERMFRPGRETEVATAMDSVLFYHNWLCAPDGADWESSVMLRDIRDYNKDDCDSTALLAEWLREVQRTSGLKWQAPKPVDHKDSEAKIARDEAAQLAQELLENLPDDPEQARIQQLLAHLLEFHWRESKPVFWAKFDRADMTEEELIEEPNCLGGLTRTNTAPQLVKKSMAYEYRYNSSQETKMDAGSECFFAHDIKTSVFVHSLDEEAGLVWVKVGPKYPTPPNRANLIPQEFVNPAKIAASVYRTVLHWKNTGELPQSLFHFLSRSRPKIVGSESGPIIGMGDITDGAISAALHLDRSALCIQGPPGTGKTYTGARMIVELLQAGKRVGVTSNSHRAITNLLKEVDSVARKCEFAFTGTKIQSKPEDFGLEGSAFATSGNMSDAVAAEYQLIGGTAWAFSDEDVVGYLDYLFVDEAGQVSLANLVGMAASTKNIVVMGDQMQLGQPLKGAHPGESGQSILQYLLQEHQTIPPELGIFLGVTYRMHPDICNFISSAVYEERLHSAEETLRRRIILPAGSTIPKSSGILFLPVEHEGNSQCSAEEADAISALIGQLTKCTVFDKEVERALLPSDILVVAPYNMQVRLLKSRHVREYVGTVDKFQGQQAIVVIISMCASDGNESARGLEFLFSKNRLNVAISRAKCLAVVVGNPRLAQTLCNKVEQMELINLYCRIVSEGRVERELISGNHQMQ